MLNTGGRSGLLEEKGPMLIVGRIAEGSLHHRFEEILRKSWSVWNYTVVPLAARKICSGHLYKFVVSLLARSAFKSGQSV